MYPSLNTIEVVKKYGLFWRLWLQRLGYAMPSYGGAGFNFALIVVLFVLLIIVLGCLCLVVKNINHD